MTYRIPKEAAEEARRGLAWRKEHGRGGTPVGAATARTLATSETVGIEKARHIAAYFPRHEVDKQAEGWSPGEKGYPSAGRIAWALWGGDAARDWSRHVVEQANKFENRAPMTDEQRRAMFAKRRTAAQYTDKINPGGAYEAAVKRRLTATTDEERKAADADIAAAAATEPRSTDTSYETEVKKATKRQMQGRLYSIDAKSGARDYADQMAQIRAWQEVNGLTVPGAGFMTGPTTGYRALMKALTGWAKTAGLAGGAAVIDAYREANPTMNPKTKKALALGEQILGYAAAISGLGTAKAQIGPKLAATAAGKSVAAFLRAIGTWTSGAASKLTATWSPEVKAGLQKAYKLFTATADFTGSSITEFGALPKTIAKTRALKARAADLIVQAHDIEREAVYLADQIRKAAKNMPAASKQLMHDIADKGLRTSAKSVQAMKDEAADIAAHAARQLTIALAKTGYVAGGMAAKIAYEENKINQLQPEAEKAMEAGKPWTYDPAKPRGPLGSAVAFLAGTLGNSFEKQFRYDDYPAQTAAYRAKYNEIDKALAAGDIDHATAESMKLELAKEEPRNMAGRAAWTFAPASAAMIAYKAKDLAEAAGRRSVETVTKIRDADTINTDKSPEGIRFLEYNAPEIPHPEQAAQQTDPAKAKIKLEGEYLGQEAERRLAELVATGQAIRRVEDSHPKASGTDKYGRELAYTETLPKPFDKLLKVRGLGKFIPAKDVNKTLLAEGLGDIRYRNLSGVTDRAREYDEARHKAKDAGVGVWSPEGRAALPWVGEAKDTPPDPTDAYPAWRKIMTPAGIGLMTTGQGGVFGMLGKAPGGAAAQLWNAALAAGGAAEYNAQAREKQPIKATMPRGLKTKQQKRLDAIDDYIRTMK